eukprot:6057564-Amphidinium_carterae.1
MDVQFQMQGDRSGRDNINRTIPIGKYMEIKTTYRQTCEDVILDRNEYKQRHFHDHSVIASNLYVNEKYAKTIITEIFQQATKKPESQPGHQH